MKALSYKQRLVQAVFFTGSRQTFVSWEIAQYQTLQAIKRKATRYELLNKGK